MGSLVRGRVDTRERTMTNTSKPEERGGDYSYDLVHEEVEQPQPEADREPHAAPIAVATQIPDDAGGDYSYDLAHDIPPQASGPR